MVRTRGRNLTYVDLWYSATGPDDQVARFAEQCRPVTILYTYGLRDSPTKVKATASWLRIYPTWDPPRADWPGVDQIDDDIILAEEPPDNYGLSENPYVRIDPELVSLPPAQRGAAYPDWLHTAMLRIATFRGWDEEPLRHAHRHCLDHDVRVHLESPRRRSPDRQHTAVLAWDVEPDGWTRMTITVRDQTNSPVRVQSQLHHAAYPGVFDWPTMRSGFGWTSNRTLEAPALIFDVWLSLDRPPPDPEPEPPVDDRPRSPL